MTLNTFKLESSPLPKERRKGRRKEGKEEIHNSTGFGLFLGFFVCSWQILRLEILFVCFSLKKCILILKKFGGALRHVGC